MKDLETNHIYAAKVVAKNTLVKSRARQKVFDYYFSYFPLNTYSFKFQLTAEIKIHRSLHHQNIVQFEHFFEDHENVYILLEMCNQKVFTRRYNVSFSYISTEYDGVNQTQRYSYRNGGSLLFIASH